MNMLGIRGRKSNGETVLGIKGTISNSTFPERAHKLPDLYSSMGGATVMYYSVLHK